MPLKILVCAALALLAGAAHAQEHAHHAHQDHVMAGMFGPQAMSREASGTSWQPEAAPMAGRHLQTGAWNGMLHGFADLVYDNQGGPRGAEKTFVPSMLMLMGRRELGAGVLGVRSMLSLDPLMGRRGYPLLFQTGETADGVTPLVDRQHPHDFLMEMAASYSLRVGDGSVFSYAGLPGEPALGPPTFMHRASGMEIPEAPMTHHWLDSTHITFGVLTLGATTERWKVETSIFNGREPDQSRWNIETDPLDSYAGRITFNPAPAWSLQASHGYLKEPEQLEPEHNVHRTTASLSHHERLETGYWSTTLAGGLNRSADHGHTGALLETTRGFARNRLFARLEWVEAEHLFDDADPLAGAHEVGKLTLGGSHDIYRGSGLRLSLGALGSAYRFPDELEPAYGERPLSYLLFLRAALE